MELIIIFIIGVIVLTFDSFLYIWRCRIFISHENNHQGLCPPKHISRAGATKTVHTHFILCLHQILDYYAIKEIFIFTCSLITYWHLFDEWKYDLKHICIMNDFNFFVC